MIDKTASNKTEVTKKEELNIKNVQIKNNGEILLTIMAKNGGTRTEAFKSFQAVFDALAGCSCSILDRHMEMLKKGLEIERKSFKKGKNNVGKKSKNGPSSTISVANAPDRPVIGVYLSGDSLFLKDLTDYDKIYWSFSDKPGTFHLYDRKHGIHAGKIKDKAIRIRAFRHSRLISSCTYSFPSSITEKYLLQDIKISDDGKKRLTITIRGKEFKTFESAEQFVRANIRDPERKVYLDRLSSEQQESAKRRQKESDVKKKPAPVLKSIMPPKAASSIQGRKQAVKPLKPLPAANIIRTQPTRISTHTTVANSDKQRDDLDKFMQNGMQAIKSSDHEKARESYLLAYKARKERGSSPISKLLRHILHEAHCSLNDDLNMAAHLYDLYYELNGMNSDVPYVMNEELHIWGDSIVDWKKMIAVKPARENNESVELPEGVIGITKEYASVLEKAKVIQIPSSFRFFLLENDHMTLKNPREFLTSLCGDKPVFHVSDQNRYLSERDGVICLKNGGTPILMADNSLTDVVLPEGMVHASSELFMRPGSITSITIPKSMQTLRGKDGSTESFFSELKSLRSVRITQGNQFFTATENVISRGFETVGILPVGEELAFPFRTEGCTISIPDYWKGCSSIRFPGFFLASDYKRIVTELKPGKQMINLALFRRLKQSGMLYNNNSIKTVIYDAFGEIPAEQLSLTFRRRARLTDGTVAPAIPLGINDIVSVLNTFMCINRGHEMIEIVGLVGYGRGDGPPKEKEVRCFYCRNCERYFMYSTDFNLFIYPLIASKTCMFTKFRYNDKLYDSSLGLQTDGFAQESLLRKAGYQVNQSADLSAKERISILMFLYDRGVSPHFILSYLNQFISLNGSSQSKDMSVAVSRWREDMLEFKAQVFGTSTSRHR